MSYKNRALWQMVVMICLLAPSLLQAASFGEVALSVGGIYPQGSFARYADPGFTITARATVHVPKVEFLVGWIGFSFAEFKSETVETRRILYEIENGPTVYRDVDQTTDENMVAGHIGLQLSTDT